MVSRLRSEYHIRRQHALELIAAGQPMRQVADTLGVALSTVYRWREQVPGWEARPRRAPSEPPRKSADRVDDMLRTEGPAIARVLLDMAKGGDVRAASLVVKLLGNTLTSEDTDDDDSDAALRGLERSLRALPADIASEIVGLLAEADSGAAKRGGGQGAASGRGRGRAVRLPWQAHDSPSDEGDDPV